MPLKHRRLGFILAVVSFFYYAAGLSHYAFPHDWTTALTAAAGGHPFLPLQRPLWQSVTLLTGQLPGQAPLVAMNLLSAALSALAVWLIYMVAYYWRIRPPLRYLFSVEDVRVMEQSRLWAAVITALTLMTSAPVFAAATTGHPNALDAALFAGVFWMSVRFRETESLRYAMGAGLLLGFGIMEHALFLLMMPFLFLWWVLLVRRAEPGRRMISGLSLLFWLLPGLFWSATFCFIYSALPSSAATGLTDPLHVMWQFLAYYNRMFAQVVGQVGWLLIVLTAFLPAVYLHFAGFQPPEGTEHSAGQWLMRSVLVLLAILLLFNFPGTPASVSALLGLNLPYIITALWIGQLLAYLLAVIRVHLPGSGRMDANKKPFQLAVLFVLLCFAGASVLTAHRYHPRQGEPLRHVARSMLEAMGPRNYLVSVGYMDDLLFWEARSRGQDISLIQLRYALNPFYRNYLANKLLGLSIRFTGPPSMDRIFEERFATVANLHDVLAVEHRPEWWTASGFEWFPGAGIYLGVPRTIDVKELMNGPEARRTLQLLEEQRVALRPRRLNHASLQPTLEVLRHRLSILANNLGYRYAGAGRNEDAGAAFEIALDYNLNNLSAMLNRIPLLTRGGRKLEADLVEERAKRRLALDASLDREVLADSFGHIYEDAEWVSKASWWPVKEPEPVDARPAATNNQLHVTLKRINDMIRDPATRGPATLELLALGESLQHKELMQTAISILSGMPDYPDGQRLLFNYALRQGDVEAARGFLDQVEKIKPGDRDVLRARIEFERRYGDHEKMLALAREALALDPDDAAMNYLLAEDMARTGRYDDAEAALLAIAPERRDALIHTGLALHTWNQKRFDDALGWIDRAIVQAPEHPHVAGVKGIILASKADWKAALPWLEKAEATTPADRPSMFRIYLAQTYMKLDQPDRVRPLLNGITEDGLNDEEKAILLQMLNELIP